MKGTTTCEYERFVVEGVPGGIPHSPERVKFKITANVGTIDFEEIRHKYFTVLRADLDLKYNALMESNTGLTDKVAFYMLDYGVGGIPAFGKENYTTVGHVGGGDCYLAYTPSLVELHQFKAQKAKPLYVEVNAEYFNSLLPEHNSFSGMLRDKIGNRQFFGVKASRLSYAYFRPIFDMYDCPLDGSLGNMMMEGTLQQFVAMQLSRFTDLAPQNEKINRRDREIILSVKEYLHATFEQNHSLIELSKQFGINQNKLKKIFRELIGVPVIEYLYNLKMEHAKTMLYDQGMYVSEVAPIVGYKNANHFATAFKRKFGINPSKVS